MVDPSIEHWIVVPHDDQSLFRPLHNHRRRILSHRDLLPGWVKVPMPGPVWRRRLGLPRRDVFLTRFSLPVRGWIMQQVLKLATALASDADIAIHADSDNSFIRPLRLDDFVRGEKVRLFREPDRVDLDTHDRWHAVANQLFGLPTGTPHAGDYIDPLVSWRRSVVQQMVDRLQHLSGAPWQTTLARTPHFAEYILYGVFAETVLGLEAAGLFVDTRSLCHVQWTGTLQNAAEERAFLAAIRPHHIACQLQSTIDVSPEGRRRLYDAVCAVAREQDTAMA